MTMIDERLNDVEDEAILWPLSYGEQRSPEQVEIDAFIKERVLRGIALLERVHGPDWIDKIDIESLDLCDSTTCVLGQVYAEEADRSSVSGWVFDGYHVGAGRLGLATAVARSAAGFSVHMEDYKHLYDEENSWERLQEIWEEALAPRVKQREELHE